MDWKKYDEIKRRLFHKLRVEMSFDYSEIGFSEYRKKFQKIPNILVDEWSSIEKENQNHPNLLRFKGALYEALFYFACLDTQAFLIDAEILEMGGEKFPESPAWFVAIPLYGVIPQLHQIYENGEWKRKAPQVDADFIMVYVDDKGPAPPALVDVKSSKPSYDEKRFGWQIAAAIRMGFIFQVAYPKEGVEYPQCLKDWEFRTPCPTCKTLSRDYRRCSECGSVIFLFTIVDARYTLKELIERLRMYYKGRF
jgi:hypothetical protein